MADNIPHSRLPKSPSLIKSPEHSQCQVYNPHLLRCYKIHWRFHWRLLKVPINKIQAQIMSCGRPMMASLLADICVGWIQWVKVIHIWHHFDTIMISKHTYIKHSTNVVGSSTMCGLLLYLISLPHCRDITVGHLNSCAALFTIWI